MRSIVLCIERYNFSPWRLLRIVARAAAASFKFGSREYPVSCRERKRVCEIATLAAAGASVN
jgi:hypothetical protein